MWDRHVSKPIMASPWEGSEKPPSAPSNFSSLWASLGKAEKAEQNRAKFNLKNIKHDD